MATDWGDVLKDMLAAAEAVAKNQWPKLRGAATGQLQALADVGAEIEVRSKLPGKEGISEDDAKFLVGQTKLAAQNVLLQIEGMTKILIEQAVNAALDVLRTAIKAATGFVV